MSDLRDTTLNIEVVGKSGARIKTEVPVIAYADESGTASKVEIQLEDVVKLAVNTITPWVEMLTEIVIKQGEQIRVLQERQPK
jgi:hypothetical protein